jgi:protein TonB
MKLLPLVLLLYFIQCAGIERSNKSDCAYEIDSKSNKKVYIFVHEMPEFIGGETELIKFFALNYKLPDTENLNMSFLLEFIIEIDGSLRYIRIKNKNIDQLTESEKEAIRVLSISPKWKPGKCNGENVPVKLFLPIKF